MKNSTLMHKVVALCLGVVCLYSTHVSAQIEEDNFHYGFMVGGTLARLTNINTSLIRPVFDQSTYSTSEKSRFGVSAGFFLYNRFKKSKLAVQPEISYAQYGGSFDYSDINDLTYSIDFNYDYFNVAMQLKVHPVGGLFTGVGPQVGFNLSEQLTYISNEPLTGPDLQIQRSLQEVLKARTDFSFIASLGYEFRQGLVFEGRYKVGVSDAMQTLSNGFYFIENDNNSSAFQFLVAYAIPFY